MRYLHQPYLELQFYHSDNTDQRQRFINFIEALVRLGGIPSNEGRQILKPGLEKLPGSLFVLEEKLLPVEQFSFSEKDWKKAIVTSEFLIYDVFMYNITNMLPMDVAERVTHINMLPKYENTDHHPLAVYTEYAPFTTIPDIQGSVEVPFKIARDKVIQCFLKIAQETNALYAIITSGESLPCLSELMNEDKVSSTFDNFYIGRNFLSSQQIDAIIKLHKDAYVSEVDKGIYISTTAKFNYKDISWNWRKLHPNRLLQFLNIIRG